MMFLTRDRTNIYGGTTMTGGRRASSLHHQQLDWTCLARSRYTENDFRAIHLCPVLNSICHLLQHEIFRRLGWWPWAIPTSQRPLVSWQWFMMYNCPCPCTAWRKYIKQMLPDIITLVTIFSASTSSPPVSPFHVDSVTLWASRCWYCFPESHLCNATLGLARCLNGDCYEVAKECDGFIDCYDATDEIACE